MEIDTIVSDGIRRARLDASGFVTACIDGGLTIEVLTEQTGLTESELREHKAPSPNPSCPAAAVVVLKICWAACAAAAQRGLGPDWLNDPSTRFDGATALEFLRQTDAATLHERLAA